MAGSRRTTGVLGPLGLLLVTVLWLATVSGNTPSPSLTTPLSQPARFADPIAHVGRFTPGASAVRGPLPHLPGTGA